MVAAESAELLAVLDEQGLPTGETKARDLVHRDGDWHRAVHVWIVRSDGGVILQRRSLDKSIEPGKLDVSVGGHLLAGELPIDATREVEEELGLRLRPGQLEFIGSFLCQRTYPRAVPPQVDREFRDVYAVRDARPLDQYLLAPAEVDTVYEVPLRRAIALFESRTPVAAAGFDSMRRPSDALLYEGDLPSQGGSSLLEGLKAVAAWLDDEPTPPG